MTPTTLSPLPTPTAPATIRRSAPRYVTGLDLGQSQDPTAIVIDEQVTETVIGSKRPPILRHTARYMERLALGTPYPEIVEVVRELFEAPPLAGSLLLLDRTGVGAPVYDMFARSKIKATVIGMTITCGQKPGKGTVPKKDLVGGIQAVLGARRLELPPSPPGFPPNPFREALAAELEAFRVRVTEDRNETFSSWRERDHDDLVLALALAVWHGERAGPQGGNFRPQAATNGQPAGPITVQARPTGVVTVQSRPAGLVRVAPG